MEDRKRDTAKRQALEQSGTLNRYADNVTDPKFKNVAFFDPEDIMQVKYEMLRSFKKDEIGIKQASKNFGFSRLTFYKTDKAFKEHGLAGLLPKKKGPRRAHKLSGEVMEFVKELTEKKPEIKILSSKFPSPAALRPPKTESKEAKRAMEKSLE